MIFVSMEAGWNMVVAGSKTKLMSDLKLVDVSGTEGRNI